MATADHSRHERLTKTVVEAIEPPATGYIIVWDVPRAGERRGFAVRVNSGGARAYFVQGRLPGGKEVKPTIGRQARLDARAGARQGADAARGDRRRHRSDRGEARRSQGRAGTPGRHRRSGASAAAG